MRAALARLSRHRPLPTALPKEAAQHAPRTGRARILRRIERVAAPPRRRRAGGGCVGCIGWGALRWSSRTAGCGSGRAPTALHALQLRFELLVAILQLLDRAGELADLRFETADPLRKSPGRNLRDGALQAAPPAGAAPAAAAARAERRRPPGCTPAAETRSLSPKRSLRNPCAWAAQGARATMAGERRHHGQPKLMRNIGPDLAVIFGLLAYGSLRPNCDPIVRQKVFKFLHRNQTQKAASKALRMAGRLFRPRGVADHDDLLTGPREAP